MTVLLERIVLIAKLSTYADCDPDEQDIVSIWISEMAATAKKNCLKSFLTLTLQGRFTKFKVKACALALHALCALFCMIPKGSRNA